MHSPDAHCAAGCAVRAHPRQALIQVHGCVVLKNATALGDTAALKAALQPGGVDAATRAVTDAMAAHVTHEAVQQCGCHALAMLASVATRLGAKSEQGAGARQPRAAGRRAQLELMAAAVVSAMCAAPPPPPRSITCALRSVPSALRARGVRAHARRMRAAADGDASSGGGAGTRARRE